jgi:TseV toxin immunity protein TsiV
MADSDWKFLTKWGESLVRDEDGRVAICFGLAATLYFHDGHSEEKRRASLECFDEYDRMCGASLHWCYASASSSRMSSVEKLRSRDMSPFLLSPQWDALEAHEHGWGFYWHGGAQPDDASPFKIYAYGSPKMYAELDGSLSFLQASFPVLWFQGNPKEFPDLILRWSERLKAYHGYGGVTLIESPDEGLSQIHSTDIAAFAGRYPGIEIDDPMSHKLAAQNGIKGGNWLTILSTGFVEKLGGRDTLREQLGEPFIVEYYDGGVIIMAGAVPEVGDRNRNIDIPNYKRLAKVLRPIRIQNHPPPYAAGRFAEDGEYEAWLARFDE